MLYPVRDKLMEIATAFIDFLEIPADAVKDIVITGSQASYNYTSHSDIDLHIIVDPEKVHEDCPIVGKYLLSKKSEFNQKHDIFIYGIPVEVYTELVGEGTIHNGLFSLNTGWIDYPKKIKPLDNDVAVKAKYKEFVEAAKETKEGDLAEKLLDKIKKMRKAGLEKGGEFSVENLVFKKLRDNGIIGELMNIKKEKIDKELSLEECFTILEEIINEVSVGKWATTADAVKDERKAKAEAAKRAAETVKNNTSANVKDYVKPERALTKKGTPRKNINFYSDVDYDAYHSAQNNVRKAQKNAQELEKKAAHAEEVTKLNLPKNSKVSAQKLTNAARSSWHERFDTNQKNLQKHEPGSAQESAKRVMRSANIKFADPSWKAKGEKEQATKKAAQEIEATMDKKDKEQASKTPKETYTNYGDREHLEDTWKRAFSKSKQAKTDHENAQILQGMRNKLEKIYNQSESLEELYKGLIGVLQETICTSTAVMAPYPVDVIGRPAPFGKKKSSKKKSHGEKRAPHTKIYEEYEKQHKGSEKPAMYKYNYKKVGRLGKVMEDIATLCEAIIAEGRNEGESQADYKQRLNDKFLSNVKSEIAKIKALRRNAQKTENKARYELSKVRDDSLSALLLNDDIRQNIRKKWDASDKVKELVPVRDKLNKN